MVPHCIKTLFIQLLTKKNIRIDTQLATNIRFLLLQKACGQTLCIHLTPPLFGHVGHCPQQICLDKSGQEHGERHLTHS